jgi:DNA-directed RNA polymerase subunit M/transcription elongation factor TFIIS
MLRADPERLTKHVNALCGSNNITLAYMNADDVERVILDSTLDEDIKVEDSVIQCKKCKQRRVIFREIQSRGADEGATVYYFCKACLHRWTKR